jgi:hypothetical protein
MLPGHINSDDDLETASHAGLSARWSLLVDLQAEFGGAFVAYLLLAFVVPCSLLAYVMWGSPASPYGVIVGAAVIFSVCLTISLYSLWWYVWAKRREERAFKLMQQRGEEEYQAIERLAWDKVDRQR